MFNTFALYIGEDFSTLPPSMCTELASEYCVSQAVAGPYMVNTYFMLATMILAAMAVLGTYFMPEVTFGYEQFETPLIYAAWGTLPISPPTYRK